MVVTVSGVGSEGLAFTVTGPGTAGPAVGTVSPAQGAAGTEVVIRGTDFGPPEGAAQGTAGVSFNGVAGTPASWSGTEIRVAVPEGATTGPVVVTVGGEASNGVGFTVTATGALRPSIVSVSPELGAVGTEVVIRGEHFGSPIAAVQGRSGVRFNGVWGVPTHWSEAEIRAAVPEGVASGLVAVTVGGQASNGVEFTVTAGGKGTAGAVATTVSASTSEGEENSGPAITSLSPEEGAVGASVTVTGTGFGAAQGNSTVSFNGVVGVPTSWSETAIQVPVPEGAASGPVVVTVGDQASPGVAFRVLSRLTLTITPLSVSERPGDNAANVEVSVPSAVGSDLAVALHHPEEGTVDHRTDYSLTKMVVIPQGSTLAAATLAVGDDTVYESDETVEIRASARGYGDSEVVTVALRDNDEPLTLTVDPLSRSEREGERTATVTVSVEEPAEGLVRVFLIQHGGNANSNTDYALVDNEVWIQPAGTSVTTTLEVIDDTVDEEEETVVLLASTYGPDYADSEEVTVTIEDDDPRITGLSPDSGLPGDSVTISGDRLGGATAVTFAQGDNRVAASSFTVVSDTEIEATVPAGATTGAIEVTTPAATAPSASPFTVLRLFLTTSQSRVAEPNGTATLTVSVEEPAEGLVRVFLIQQGGLADRNIDYALVDPDTDYALVDPEVWIQPAGTSVKTTLEVIDDAVDEEEETVVLLASTYGPDYADSQEVTVRIEDDDTAGVTVTPTSLSLTEEGTGTTYQVRLDSKPTHTVTITIDSDNPDLEVDPASLSFGPGNWSTPRAVTVEAARDDGYDDESGTLTHGADSEAPNYGEELAIDGVTVAVEDNELPPLTLTADAASVSEPDGTVTLTVTVPAGAAPPAEATITLTHSGSASNGPEDTDYTVGTLTIKKGYLSDTATLQVIDDTVYEGTEVIWIQAAKEGFKISPTLKIPLEDNEQNQAPVVSPPLPALTTNVGAAETVSLSSHFSDPEGHDLVYTASSSHPSMVTVSVSGSTLTVTGVAVGRSTITVTATDRPQDSDDSLPTRTTFTATVENRAPECEDIDDQTVNVNASKTLTVSCTDPDGHSLSYTASSSPSGIVTPSMSGSSVTVTGAAVGSATVTVTATDGNNGSDTVEFNVTVPNRPPPCSDIPAQTLLVAGSQTVELSQYCSDPDGHPLTYAVTSSETDEVTASVDGSTLTLTGVAVGSSTITVMATDQPGESQEPLSTSTTFTATVENRDPVCEDVADQTVTAGQSKTLTVSCTDPDGHELSYTTSSSPTDKVTVSNDGASVTITGVVAGIPTVTVTASDGNQGSDMVTFTVTVPNQAPVCSDIPAQTFVVADSQTVDLSQYCSDPDGHPLTYQASSSSPSNVTASVDGSTLTLTGVAVTAETLPTITVTATDEPDKPQEPLSDTETFSATIENHDPECEDIAGQEVKVGQSKTLTVSCTDPDGHPLSYTTSSSPTDTVTVSNDGASVTVNAAAVGSATVTVTASDGYGGTTKKKFNVTVPTPPCAISSIDGQTVKVSKSKTVSLSATCDPPADTLTYTATSSDTAKATVSVSGSTLTVTGVDAGTATVTVTVSDGRGGSDIGTFDVTVERLNEPPVCSFSTQTIDVGDSTDLGVTAHCTDADGDDMTFTSASSKHTSIATVSRHNSNTTVRIRGVAVGRTNVTVTVSDGHGGSTTKTFDVNVVQPNRPPVISRISPNLGQTDTRATIYGANFGTDEGSVSFGGSSADINSWNDTWISVLVPLHLSVGTVSVSVTTAHSAGSKTSNSVTFRVTGGPVQSDEEEECEDEKDCPEDEGEGEEKGEEAGEEESGDSGETEEDPSGG